MAGRSLSRDEVRDVDRRAIEEYGLPGIVLMENAGRGVVEVLAAQKVSGPVVVCAGKGNNGGDGFVIARHLDLRGHAVRVLLFADPSELRDDAATNFRVLENSGIAIRVFDESSADGTIDLAELDAELDEAEWIVDALLGTGVRGAVRAPYDIVISRIDSASRKVLAVDLPSGLDCDLGTPSGSCVRADLTATFVARKRGFDVPESRQWTGEVRVVGIGVPRRLLESLS